VEHIKSIIIKKGGKFTYAHKRNTKGEITYLKFEIKSKGTGNYTSESPFELVSFGTFHSGGIFIAGDKKGAKEMIEGKRKAEIKINDKQILQKESEEFIISGTVTNNDGKGLPGTNIIIKGTSTGTQTDFDGNYVIKASKGDKLVYSFKGMSSVKNC